MGSRLGVRVTLAGAMLMLCGLSPAPLEPSEPSHLQAGPLTVGIEAAASIAPADPAFFNFTEYYGNPLRTALLGVSGALRLGPALALLAEVRSEDGNAPRVHALYLRVRPWQERSFDLQAGRIPPVFGSFARRSYGSGNPFVGQPLGYQYLVSVRSDAVPVTADDLLATRGEGWLVRYPNQLGPPDPHAGVPLVQGQNWDAGLEARVGGEPWQLAVALTQGTLGRPQLRDNNGGKQLSARLGFRPSPGLALGLSAARGEHLAEEVIALLPAEEARRGLDQRALGLDVEYSKDLWLARFEAIWSEWDLPKLGAPMIDDPVGALALSLEGRWKPAAGLYLAARLDRLSFTQLAGSRGRQSWDAPVSRIEGVVGYSVRRGLTLKAGYQHNWRGAGAPGRRGFPLAQVTWRF